MEKYISYIEETLAGEKDCDTLFRFKRETLDQMTERLDSIRYAGLKDDQILFDLIQEEFFDLPKRYRAFARRDYLKKRTRSRRKAVLIGTPCYIVLLIFLYLAVSFLFGHWAQTWLIIVGGIFLMLLFYSGFAIKKLSHMRRLLQPFARLLVAIDIMLVTTFSFLFLLMLFDPPHIWVLFPAGVIALLLADAIFAGVTHQKLAIVNYLLYIPGATALLYVILGATGVCPWHPGWLMILFSVIVDILIVIGVIAHNSKYIYRQEVEDTWNAG